MAEPWGIWIQEPGANGAWFVFMDGTERRPTREHAENVAANLNESRAPEASWTAIAKPHPMSEPVMPDGPNHCYLSSTCGKGVGSVAACECNCDHCSAWCHYLELRSAYQGMPDCGGYCCAEGEGNPVFVPRQDCPKHGWGQPNGNKVFEAAWADRFRRYDVTIQRAIDCLTNPGLHDARMIAAELARILSGRGFVSVDVQKTEASISSGQGCQLDTAGVKPSRRSWLEIGSCSACHVEGPVMGFRFGSEDTFLFCHACIEALAHAHLAYEKESQ